MPHAVRIVFDDTYSFLGYYPGFSLVFFLATNFFKALLSLSPSFNFQLLLRLADEIVPCWVISYHYNWHSTCSNSNKGSRFGYWCTPQYISDLIAIPVKIRLMCDHSRLLGVALQHKWEKYGRDFWILCDKMYRSLFRTCGSRRVNKTKIVPHNIKIFCKKATIQSK